MSEILSNSFKDLGLIPDICKAVTNEGYTKPTPIQAQAIPIILEGKDLMGGAQTGTGKTAGFTLPTLQRLMNKTVAVRGAKRPLRALVLTPTRELAAQVGESMSTYGQHLPLTTAVVFGGVSFNPQKRLLRSGIDILVATPGRLLDHVGQETVDLSQIEILILDEADRMLDMGFIRDIRKIMEILPKKRQTLLFSATFSDDIKKLASGLLNQPKIIEVARRNSTSQSIQQIVHPVDKKRKRELLSHLIGKNRWNQVLVFTRTKHGANRLAGQLSDDGIKSAAIHGNKSQGARTRALAEFKSGKIRVLVATDIAARGLDIDDLPLVCNYELPNVPEDYVHRIGRTGRAGLEGRAFSLVCIDEAKYLKDIERLIKKPITKETLAGYEPDPSIKAEQVEKQRSRRSSKGGQSRGGQSRSRQSRSGESRSGQSRSGQSRSGHKRSHSKQAN